MADEASAPNGWREHERLVLHRLKGLEIGQKEIAKDVVELRVAVSKLKIVASVMGAAASAVVAVLLQVLNMLGAG